MTCPPHPDGRSLFCPDCGRPRHDPKSVARRLMGGVGRFTENHRVRAFLDSGDPQELNRP